MSDTVPLNPGIDGVKVGDYVVRLLAGVIPMQLRVTAITADRIKCGSWEFDKATGAEIDEQLGWGPKFGITGSYIQLADAEPP